MIMDTRRRILACVIASVSSLLFAACSRDTQPSTSATQPQTTNDRADWPEVIRIGLVPSEGGVDIVERFAPLIDHLRKELNHPVEARSATEYIGVITAMQNKQVEFAYFGPKSYVEAHTMAGAEALVRELDAQGNPGYRALIIVHKDSPFQTLQDLKGASFGFVTENSTSGFLIPAVGIRETTGLAPEQFFGSIVWTGTHGNAAHSVARREIDAAANNDLDLLAMHNAGAINTEDFRTVWTSELIPSSPLAARSDIPESLKAAFRDAVLSMNENPDALNAMSRGGYQPASDADYEPIRVLQSVQTINAGG